jgi:anti-sigma regulatory factor (Ser/Thr protein kinase)
MTGPGPTELVRLEIPPLPAFVGVARVVIASAATTADGLDDGQLEDLGIAVSEACTNAVASQRGEQDGERVVVRCTLGVDALEVHIEGIGSGFDSHEPIDVSSSDEEHLDEAAEQGWGIQLIRALVDDVSFSTTGDGRPAVRLLVQLRDQL